MGSQMNLILEGNGAFFLWETKGEYLFEALVMPVSGCYSSVTIKLTEEQKVKILADESCAMILFSDINGNAAKYQKEQGAIPEVRTPEQERILGAKREELIKEIQEFRDRPLDPNHKMEEVYVGKPQFDAHGNRVYPSLDAAFLMKLSVEGDFPIRIRKGTNGKVAIIGIGMNEKGGVCDMSRMMVGAGYTTFLYAGKNLSKTTRREFACLSAIYGDSRGWIPNEYLEGSSGLRENNFWSQKVVDDGYTIVDMGNPFGRGESVYCTSESEIMDGQWVIDD